MFPGGEIRVGSSPTLINFLFLLHLFLLISENRLFWENCGITSSTLTWRNVAELDDTSSGISPPPERSSLGTAALLLEDLERN